MINLHFSRTGRRFKTALSYPFWAHRKSQAKPAWLKVPALLVIALLLSPSPMFGQNARTTALLARSNKVVSKRTFNPQNFLTDQAARPDNPALCISRSVANYVDDQLRDHNKAVTAGMPPSKEMEQVGPVPPTVNEWFSSPTLRAEYDYISSDDQRTNGADSHTNSATAYFGFFTKYDILIALTYRYGDRDADSSPLNFPDAENSHFFSLDLSKSFWQCLNIGLNGGYGYFSTAQLGTDTGSEDSWNVSPYVDVSHSWGAFSATLRTLYQYAWTNAYLQPGDASDQTGRVVVTLILDYKMTERLSAAATAAYVGMTTYTSAAQNLPQARNWATFGASLTYALIGPLNVFAGFAYDAFNQGRNDYTVQGGLSYSW
jgi:hypothetical protein